MEYALLTSAWRIATVACAACGAARMEVMNGGAKLTWLVVARPLPRPRPLPLFALLGNLFSERPATEAAFPLT